MASKTMSRSIDLSRITLQWANVKKWGWGSGGQFHINHCILSTQTSSWCICWKECGKGLLTSILQIWTKKVTTEGMVAQLFLVQLEKMAGDRFHMTSRRPYWCTKQWSGGHVGVPKKACGDWIVSSCKNFLLFQELVCIAADHWRENDL